MNKIITFVLLFGALALQAQDKKELKHQTVEASCGQCNFGLKGGGCDLAVRIDGKAYPVDGTKIDQHGDAHAKDGFFSAVRQAVVSGEIVGNRFKATEFELLPLESNKKK
jgi:hypothetical protein